MGPAEASPSGNAVAAGAVHIANLRGGRLREVPLDDLSNTFERFAGQYGRLRDVVLASDGATRRPALTTTCVSPSIELEATGTAGVGG